MYGPSPSPPYSFGTTGACSPARNRSSKSSNGNVAVSIVCRGAWSKVFARQHGDAIDDLLLLESQIEQIVGPVDGGGLVVIGYVAYFSCASDFLASGDISFPVIRRN